MYFINLEIKCLYYYERYMYFMKYILLALKEKIIIMSDIPFFTIYLITFLSKKIFLIKCPLI